MQTGAEEDTCSGVEGSAAVCWYELGNGERGLFRILTSESAASPKSCCPDVPLGDPALAVSPLHPPVVEQLL